MIGYDRNKTMACEICGKQQYRVNDPVTVVVNAGLKEGVRCNDHMTTPTLTRPHIAVGVVPFHPTFDKKGRLIGGMR